MSYQPGDINNDGNPGTAADLVQLMTQINFLEHNETNSIARTNDLNQKDIDYLAKHIVGMSGYDLPSGGMFIQNTTNGNIGIGHGSIVQHSNVNINTLNSIAIGNNSQSVYDNSIAIGTNVVTTEANQIVIGDANSNIVLNGNNNFNNIISSELNVHGDISGNTANLTGLNVDGDISGNTANLTGLNVTGNVGIGTTSVDNKLTVSGGIKVDGIGTSTGLTMDNMFYLRRNDNGATYSSYNHHAFYTNSTSGAETGSERMRIDQNGNVGIGTSIPESALDISGGLIVSGKVGTFMGSDHTEAVAVNGDIVLVNAEYADGIDRYVKCQSGTLHLESEYRLNITSDNNNNNPNAPADIIFNTGQYERMRINRTLGRVGIGTNIPSGKLTVKVTTQYDGIILNNEDDNLLAKLARDDAENSYLSLYEYTTTHNTKVRLHSSGDSYFNGGNVGIGTTSPESALDISGDLVVRGSMEIEKPIDSAAYGAGTHIMNFKTYYPPAYDKGTIKSAIISGVSDKTTQRTDNGYLAFATADAGTLYERMRIEKNGNVGIGTTTPGATLDVAGNIKSSGEIYVDSWFRVNGTAGIHWETYGGGWWMYDTSWIRTWQNKGIATGGGQIHTGGGQIDCGTINSGTINSGKILTNNRVGIDVDGGTTDPLVPLHISGSVSKQVKGSGSGNYYNGMHEYIGWNVYAGITSFQNFETHNISIFSPGGFFVSRGLMAAQTVEFNSDKRIKTNIKEINDDEALKKLRLLKPCTYNYIDYLERGITPVYGFIAQEVKEVLPYAVTDGLALDNVIPNIYKFCHVTNGITLSFADYDISNNITIDGLEYDIPEVDCTTSTFQRDASNNITITLKNKDGKEFTRNVINIIDDKTFEIDVKIEENELAKDGTIFVFGQAVDDFCRLNKSAIWTVATAALQEVDRQLQTEKSNVLDLQAKNTILESKTASLESQVANLNTKLDNLLNKFNTLETIILNN